MKETVKETGIIMSGNHPQLILDGIKTVTRRTYGLEKVNQEPDAWEFKRLNNGGIALFWRKNIMEEDIALCKCPYGQVGDRLWVRETHAKRILPSGGEQILYKTQFEELVKMLDLNEFAERMGYPHLKPSWKPSIHMFRKDSRITLEITGLRSERVQEITPEEVIKEGCQLTGEIFLSPQKERPVLIDKFARLWDSLNAKRGYGWDFNPWVWPIEIKQALI